jgi:hypothetical protein
MLQSVLLCSSQYYYAPVSISMLQSVLLCSSQYYYASVSIAMLQSVLKYLILPGKFHTFTPRHMTAVSIMVKFSLERAMKAQRGSRGIALLFL